MKPKKELTRVVKTQDGQFIIDTTGKASGRGAYITNTKEVLEKCTKTKALNRAFKGNVPQNVYDMLKSTIEVGLNIE